MSSYTPEDSRFMARAIELARCGVLTTRPNPAVGCVLVKGGEIVGQGFHQQAGGPHAEIVALRQAGESARDATAYVSLEPCAHTGKTGPCAEALVNAGVGRVIAAMQDPNPAVAGKGFAILESSNIPTSSGLMESEARQLNPGFIKRMESGLPFVRLKQAMSLDGRTAMASGESQWITGPDARAQVQQLRASSCAVISGIDSILLDDSSLNIRAAELPLDIINSQVSLGDSSLAAFLEAHPPLRVIVDSRLRLPTDARMLSLPGKTLVATHETANPEKAAELEAAGAEILYLPGCRLSFTDHPRVDLQALLAALAARQCNEVLLECGATLAGSFVAQGLVDEMHIFMAGKLMGNHARGLLDLPFESMSQALDVSIKDIRAIGADWRIIATPVKK